MTRPGPRRRWYAVAGIVALVGVGLAILVFLVRLNAWTGEFPRLGERYRSGQAIPVDITAGTPLVLYVSPDAYDPLSCAGEVAGAPLDVTEIDYTFTFFSGGRSWAAALEIRSGTTGTGSLTCSGSSAVSYAVGGKPDNGRLLRILGGGIALSAVPALLGLGGGAALAIGVARRRRAARGDSRATRSDSSAARGDR